MDRMQRFFRRPAEAELPNPSAADFVAIDFETANETRGSACAVGVALVREGQVVASGSTLIDPETYFNPYNQMIHGIDEDDVARARTFPQLWPELSRILAGQNVVAHHAPFDMSVLRSMAARYQLEGPEFSVHCSRRLAKATWPSAQSYSLGWLAPTLGIEFEHHVAGEDAIACGQLTSMICRHHAVYDLADLSQQLGFLPGRVASRSYQPFRVRGRGKLTARAGDPDADPEHPLYDKTICFTGTLASMPRREAAEQVTSVGAHFRNTVSRKLDYLVIGDADFVAFADGWVTGKLRRAREFLEEGFPIEVIPERDFLELLLGD